MKESFIKTLVKRHNALLEFYYASQELDALNQRAGATGLEKKVQNKVQTRYNEACKRVKELLEE